MNSQAPPNHEIEYLISGARPNGRRRHERITAASPDDARAEMARRGYSDITLHTDDLRRNYLFGNHARPRHVLSARDELALHHSTPFQKRLIMAKVIYRVWWLPITMAAAYLGLALWQGRPWQTPAGLFAAAALGPLAFALIRPSRTAALPRVEEALYQGDFERVLRLLPGLRRATRAIGPAASANFVTRFETSALIRLGRREDALRRIEWLRAQKVPEKLIDMRFAAVYSALGEVDNAQRHFELAVESDPGDWMSWCEMADFLAITARRPVEAREALSMIRPEELAEESQRAVRCNAALIALSEGRYEEARKGLEQALEWVNARVPTSPGWKGVRDRYGALLAIALLKTGRAEEARLLFDRSAPFLVRLRLNAELGLCAAAGLRPA